jgi:hypothetical protein
MRGQGFFLATGVLLIGIGNADAQRPKRQDPYAKPNAQLEKWVNEIGHIDVKIEGPVFEGEPKIKGLKAIYQGFFETDKKEWRIRRYAVPSYGDVLDLFSKAEMDGRFREQESVTCPKEGIRREDIKKLLRPITNR